MIKYKNFTLELAKEIQVAVLTIRDDFSANDEAKKNIIYELIVTNRFWPSILYGP